MKYKVSFESYSGDGQSSDPYYKGLLHSDMDMYSRMFNSGIRVNVGDIVYLEGLEDYHNGYYGNELSKKAFEWGGELYGGDIMKCCWIEFIPRYKDNYMEVRICLNNPD